MILALGVRSTAVEASFMLLEANVPRLMNSGMLEIYREALRGANVPGAAEG